MFPRKDPEHMTADQIRDEIKAVEREIQENQDQIRRADTFEDPRERESVAADFKFNLTWNTQTLRIYEAALALRNGKGSHNGKRPRTPKAAVTPAHPGAFHLTDVGNASRFAAMHSQSVKFCGQLGWLAWDGRRWQRDDTQEVKRLARQVVQSIYREAAESEDKERREALGNWAHRSETDSRINAMLSLAESEPDIAVRADIFDRDPWLFNVNTGTIELKTGELRGHRREDYITKLAPVEYDSDAPCTQWYRFLETIFNNPPLVEYLQKFIGYCLTGDTSHQLFHILYGVGANGKTTLVNRLMRMLGDYAVRSPVDTFLQKRDAGAIPNDVARLAGARLVTATESGANARLAESIVKNVTGGERIAARFLHREFFEFDPTFKLILSTNHKPRIVGTDHAIWRRIRLVPFEVIIPDDQQDQTLPDKLDGELPGIFRWAVEGCLLYQREGLKVPDAVLGASCAYREEMDTLGDFISASCVTNPRAQASAKDLYAAYVKWCAENGEREVSQRSFGFGLGERGFVKEPTRNGVFWQGIGLRE